MTPHKTPTRMKKRLERENLLISAYFGSLIGFSIWVIGWSFK